MKYSFNKKNLDILCFFFYKKKLRERERFKKKK